MVKFDDRMVALTVKTKYEGYRKNISRRKMK